MSDFDPERTRKMTQTEREMFGLTTPTVDTSKVPSPHPKDAEIRGANSRRDRNRMSAKIRQEWEDGADGRPEPPVWDLRAAAQAQRAARNRSIFPPTDETGDGA